LIEIHSLSKKYTGDNPAALDEVTFDVRDGEIVGFVGLNGAGKTTLIRIAAGIALPTSGTVTIDCFDIANDKVEASSRIGWVPEYPNFEMGAKALSLMKYFCGFYKIPSRTADEISRRLLTQVGLGGVENRKLRTYSQGMKKRFSLAASMIADPANYLLDEVLNGLDPEGVHYVRGLLHEMRASKKAVLISSHILKEVQAVSDRIVFLHNGKLVKILSRDELSRQGSDLEDVFFQSIQQEPTGMLK